ncbi:MAG: fused DSP-PTPase phosphatase/NAD kinase-like protein [Planctomycetia bacterium]
MASDSTDDADRRVARRWTAAVLIAGGVVIAAHYVLLAHRDQNIPKNWAAVKPGVLYRGGQLSADHFQRLAVGCGVRTVVCLNPGEVDYERALAKRLGLDFVALPMPGSGCGRPEQFHEFLRIVGDPERRPVYVHCGAGSNRTGVAVALYRLVYDGWAMEDVLREMRYFGYAGQNDMYRRIAETFQSTPPDLIGAVAPAALKPAAASSTAAHARDREDGRVRR